MWLFRFLDIMQNVLKEQRREGVPPSGLRILLAIEGECTRLESAATNFLQRHIVIRLCTIESTVVRRPSFPRSRCFIGVLYLCLPMHMHSYCMHVSLQEALQQSRVNLNEHWTLYLVSISAAGSGSKRKLSVEVPPSTGTDGSCSGLIKEHLCHFSRAVDVMNSGNSDDGSAQRLLRALSCHPPGKLSDEQEKKLSVAVLHVQQQLSVPTDVFRSLPSASSGLLKQLEAMREAMLASISSGVAQLQSQLQEIVRLVSQQNEAIVEGNEKVLSEIKGVREVCVAMAYGVKAPLKPEDRELLDRFSAGVEKEEQCVFDQNIMACPITRLPFKPGCDREPTLVPGCHCTVARAVAEMYQQEGLCGVCQEAVPEQEALRPDGIALRFLDDLDNNRLPAIRKFDIDNDFREQKQRGKRQGTEGVVRFGMLRGESVAVKTMEFATMDASQRQWRCRRHVMLNSICTQHRAAQASEFVCDVVGLCWGKSCAHIAMPVFTCTLEDHVQRDATRGMPLHHTLELCCALTRAVHDVHACGILHCDINPANVLLAKDGTPRLIDFGLSHVSRDGLQTRTSMGFTPQYAPKEQSEGGRVNEASDIYALGRTLAYAATGMRPSRRGQRMPTEPLELAQALRAMTGSEETRKAVRLVQVIATFEKLRTEHGPTPVRSSSPVSLR